MIAGPAPAGCSVSRSTGAGGLKVETRCREGGVTTRFKLTMTGSDTRYDVVVATEMSMADGTHTAGEERATARRIGACPAGAMPGDTVPVTGG
jgi:hypothetical protein